VVTGPVIVIGTFLEADLVQRVAGAVPSARLVYEPDLLPEPRFPCDHTGRPRDLTAADLERWRSLAENADVYFDFDWLDPASMPKRSPRLRWVQATSAGIGGFMRRTGLDGSGIAVTTAAGIHAVPLAEFAVMGALHFVKGVPHLQASQRDRHWEQYTTRQLAGLRALVVGLGGIGRAVAATFSRLDIEVYGLGRDGRRYDVPGVTNVICRSDLDDVLPSVDILVLACPLTPETEGLIGAHQIGQLKPEAIIINVARGQVVDQQALTAALRDRRIVGACLDVFADEPLPPDDALWGFDNVLISPHSASIVATENAELTDLFIDNLGRFLAGAPLRNRYDPARGY
jgi:phosphoglycerate dehydrogenase-like enzyme